MTSFRLQTQAADATSDPLLFSAAKSVTVTDAGTQLLADRDITVRTPAYRTDGGQLGRGDCRQATFVWTQWKRFFDLDPPSCWESARTANNGAT